MFRLSLAPELLVSMLLLATIGPALAQTPKDRPTAEERREAERLWDSLIREKGGHERLRKVYNLLVEEYWGSAPKTYGIVSLYAFPDKYWEWSYAGPFPTPLMKFYHNEDRHYFVTTDGVKVVSGDSQSELKQSVIWLLETRWFRPEPIRVTRVRVGKQLLDVIETKFDGERFDFAIDVSAESLLVYKISRYSKIYKAGSKPVEEHLFKDYVAINGIMMPQSEAIVDDGKVGPWYKPQFSFNITYDPHFFDAPPPLSAGPDAWKPKSNDR
jgi:hypothetical protein